MKPKIAYIELDTHSEIAQNFMDLMADSLHFSVDYYFSENIRKNVVLQGSGNVFLSRFSTIFHQLKEKEYQLVIIGTVHRNFHIFKKITAHFNTAIIVHNLNFVQLSSLDLGINVFKKEVLFRLKLLLKEGLCVVPKIWKQSRNLLVLDESFAKEKNIFLPIFYTKYRLNISNDNLIIVIPGTVSQERRNYDEVFQFLKNNTFEKKIECVFLGKSTGISTSQLYALENYQEKNNFKITYFLEKVSQQEFDFWMQKANVLWCPIQKETEFFSHLEVYGSTKITGNIGDAIKYGKWAVFPKDYSSNYPFILPKQENFWQQIIGLQSREFPFEEDYSRIFIQQKLESVLKKLL